MTPKQVLEFAKNKKIEMVDLKFMDFVGTWQHFSVPIYELHEDNFEDGFGFDGSSIRGWQPIHASDMLVIPDPDTAIPDPFIRKAEAYMKSIGVADAAYFGPEAEFFIFDDIRFATASNYGYFYIDSEEGTWNTGREERPNLGYKPRHKEGYFPVPPTDSLHDIRDEMVRVMETIGLKIEAQHHEVATAGQGEIDLRFDTLVKCADALQWYKYIVKNVARKFGKTVTFMPKPLFEDNGSGMHTHQSLWKGSKPLFAGEEYGGLSKMALHYIGGILKHASAICAFSNPTTNSYKRLVPGFEAPVNLAYSSRNRSAAVRIPMYSPSPKAKRIEFRTPDPSCNGYLAFAAMLMAGLDGIQNKIHPGEPLDKDIYALSPEELAGVPTTPGSLDESLKALESDHDFLLKGDVFTADVVEKWIEYKMDAEVNPTKMRPHPHEFFLYFDC
jgi:glutamine synthetase